MNNGSKDEKITLWTAQSKIVIDTIEEKGIYHVKREYILKKYGEVANIFLQPYTWFVGKAEKIIPRPQGAQYPIWLFTDLKYVDYHKDHFILEILVDRRKVIIFDKEKWNRILNLSYVPTDKSDAEKYEHLLERQGIYDPTDVYMKNYFPYLKARVKKSWDRLFDNSITLSESKQGALWEIRRGWITKITKV